MSTVTTIVHFSMPAENTDRFLEYWQEKIRPVVERQPGLIGGTFHRHLDADGPFQFINVARWTSAPLLATALRTTVAEMLADGDDMVATLHELGVSVSQNDYSEVVRYDGTAAFE